MERIEVHKAKLGRHISYKEYSGVRTKYLAENGRLTIPAEVRKMLGWTHETPLRVLLEFDEDQATPSRIVVEEIPTSPTK